MQLFMHALEQEVAKLHQNQIRFKVVGDLSRFEPRLVELIRHGEELTTANARCTLTIAANYGGRWDIANAVKLMLAEHPEYASGFEPEALAPYLSMAYGPEANLVICTGGEQRISNFLFWQLC